MMENMCTLLLDPKGGAKRMPWRKKLILLSVNDEENDAPAGS